MRRLFVYDTRYGLGGREENGSQLPRSAISIDCDRSIGAVIGRVRINFSTRATLGFLDRAQQKRAHSATPSARDLLIFLAKAKIIHHCLRFNYRLHNKQRHTSRLIKRLRLLFDFLTYCFSV